MERVGRTDTTDRNTFPGQRGLVVSVVCWRRCYRRWPHLQETHCAVYAEAVATGRKDLHLRFRTGVVARNACKLYTRVVLLVSVFRESCVNCQSHV